MPIGKPTSIATHRRTNVEHTKAYHKAYRIQNRRQCNEYSRHYYRRHPERQALLNDRAKSYYKSRATAQDAAEWKTETEARRRLRVYGLSKTDYEALRQAQKGRCKICGQKPKQLVVDHCHETRRVRGLLCNRCNVLLGMSGDNIDILKSAIKYLRKSA